MSTRLLANGVMVIEPDTHHAEWCAGPCGLIHDPWMAENCARHLRPGDVAINGGAHIGTLTYAMLQAGAEVYAFEPNADAIACLRHNCAELFPGRLHAIQAALGAEIGSGTLHTAANAGMAWVSPGSGAVCVTTLDAAVLRDTPVKLIVLDVEGAEVAALRGGRELIARWRPVIIAEVNAGALARMRSGADELFALLEGWGYARRILQHDCEAGSPQYDIEAVCGIVRAHVQSDCPKRPHGETGRTDDGDHSRAGG